MKYNDRNTIKSGSKYQEKMDSETYYGNRAQKRRDASFLNQMLEFSYTLPDRIWWEALDKYEKPEAYDTFRYKIRQLGFWSKDYTKNKIEAIEYMMKNHQPRVEVRRELVINKILS